MRDGVLGNWVGDETYEATRKPIAIQISIHPQKHVLTMFYDNPQMKFHHMGPMPLTQDGQSYKNRYFDLTLSSDGVWLSGTKSFDGHTLRVDLHRGDLAEQNPAPQISIAERQPLWSFKSGGEIWSSPVVKDRTVYFGSNDHCLYALDTRGGSLRWQLKTGGAVVGSPSVDLETVYVLSDDGYLYKLRCNDGFILWKFDTRGGAVAREWNSGAYDYLGSAATRAESTIYVGSAANALYAVDAESGTERWHFSTKGSVRSIPAVADGRVFFGSYDHFVYALDAKSGFLLWKSDTLEPVVSSPIVARGLVYVGSRSSDLFAFDAATGAVRWDYFFWSSWVESSARVRGGVLYVGSSDYQQVFALDAADGNERWRSDVDGSVWSTPAVTRERVYVGVAGVADYFIAHHGAFYALNRHDGKAVWRHSFPQQGTTWGVATSPAVADGRVYFGALDGTFYAFRAD